MKRFLPVVIGAGLLALITIILWPRKPSDPLLPPVSTKLLGTSTLNHGNPSPVRQHATQMEQPRMDNTEPTTAR